jgi:PBSX family phage terminase large subunit
MEIKIPINPNFQRLLNIDKRYIVLIGGRGSGKSCYCAQRVILWMLNKKVQERILLCRKVLRTVRHSQYQLIKDLIYGYDLSPYFKFNNTEMKITCHVTNSEAFALGLDDPEKTKSTEGITKEWPEETTEFSYKDFLDIDLLMRGESNTNYQMLLSFNPINEHHWLNDFFFSIRNRMLLFSNQLFGIMFLLKINMLKFLRQSAIRIYEKFTLKANGAHCKTSFMHPTNLLINIRLWMKRFMALIFASIIQRHCLKLV